MNAMTRCVGRATRAAMLVAACTIGLACSGDRSAREEPTGNATLITVYKSPTCGCCTAWVDHLRNEGFRVVAIDTTDLEPIKRRYDVPRRLSSCHTAVVGNYVIEGHVPAADIRRLLAERPQIRGLAVPGMPQGSPGMETGVTERYDVLALMGDGKATVFATHR